MKCLHRFCEECIVDALRKGRKECPTCRVKLTSHRDLRSEPRIDFLLGTLLGDLDEWEDNHALQLEHFTQSLNVQALQASVEKGMMRQSSIRKRELKKKKQPVSYVLLLYLSFFFFLES